jgi:hypothetical protein
MCAETSAGVRDGTEAFALGGFTETLGGIQAAILKDPSSAGSQPGDGYLKLLELRLPLLSELTAQGWRCLFSRAHSAVT